MSISDSARLRELLRQFKYSGPMTREELITIQVPSPYFPNEKALDMALEDGQDKDLIGFRQSDNKYYEIEQYP